MTTIQERWARSPELRRTWKRTGRDGAPCRVAHTMGASRKARTESDSHDCITGVTPHRPDEPPSASQPRDLLIDLNDRS